MAHHKFGDIPSDLKGLIDDLHKVTEEDFQTRIDLSEHDETIAPLGQAINDFLYQVQKRVESLNLDVRERNELIAKLEQSNRIDALTGTLNRNTFQVLVDTQLSIYKRHGSIFALAIFDIDNFKNINDGCGHAIGDQALKQVAKRVKSVLRKGDYVARVGGDEFAILFGQLGTPEEAGIIADRVHKALLNPFNIDGHEFGCSVSMGIATCPHAGMDQKTLLKNADLALYKAKTSGGQSHVFFSDEIYQAYLKQEYIFDLLQMTFENTFTLHYLPTFSINGGQIKIEGVELLLRPKIHIREDVSITDVIHVAELRGVMPQFGQNILKLAFDEITELSELYPHLDFAINLSASEIDANEAFSTIKTLADEYDAPVERILFEVNEAAFREKEERLSVVLHELKREGFQIAIDDFGKGYSSLTRIRNLPVDVLKIDLSFTHRLTYDEHMKHIVKAIIDLARSLNLRVVCEGVETKGQFDILKTLDGDLAQGYHLAKPVSKEDLHAIVNKYSQ